VLAIEGHVRCVLLASSIGALAMLHMKADGLLALSVSPARHNLVLVVSLALLHDFLGAITTNSACLHSTGHPLRSLVSRHVLDGTSMQHVQAAFLLTMLA